MRLPPNGDRGNDALAWLTNWHQSPHHQQTWNADAGSREVKCGFHSGPRRRPRTLNRPHPSPLEAPGD
jgi:hypothetical protein